MWCIQLMVRSKLPEVRREFKPQIGIVLRPPGGNGPDRGWVQSTSRSE